MPANWSIEQRKAAAKRARLNRPWLYSTGPRTAEGKRASSRNSYKHGHYSCERQFIRFYLRLCALRLKQSKAFLIGQNHKHTEWKKTRNELTLKYYKPDLNPLRFPTEFLRMAPQNMPHQVKRPGYQDTAGGRGGGRGGG
jgi:hypothetical protein